MYTAGFVSIGASFASWMASNRLEASGMDRADRWGIFVGEWAPTFFAIGVALRTEEMQDGGMPDTMGHRRTADEKADGRADASAVMR
ncbi:hypothetical protein BJF79_23730 [Actinomadura sp. CNU-125]|nr:hypothetical protein BJF79_23730 [Actinomadura sp. CNU-125]